MPLLLWWMRRRALKPPAPAPAPPAQPVVPVTRWGWPDTEEEWLARTLWGEAANEQDGPLYVLSVIVNRKRASPSKSWKEIVLEPYQFGVWVPITAPEAATAAHWRNFERTVRLVQPAAYERYRAWARQAVTGEFKSLLPSDVKNYVERTVWEQRRDSWMLACQEVPVDRVYTHVFLRCP